MNATFFGDMLQTIADRGRALLERTLPGRVGWRHAFAEPGR